MLYSNDLITGNVPKLYQYSDCTSIQIANALITLLLICGHNFLNQVDKAFDYV